jgi:hypothetical protein
MNSHNLRRKLGRAYTLLRSVVNVGRGMACYPWRGEVGLDTWEGFLDLHCRTNGRSTEVLRRVMRQLKPPPAVIPAFNSVLGSFDAAKLNDISEQIRRDGYYVFPTLVPEAICQEIIEKARKTEGWTRWHGKGYETVPIFDPTHPITPRYVMPEAKIWQLLAYQRLVADPLFVNLSQSYFRGVSVLKDISLWWSPVTGSAPDEDAAQLFHFDYEPIPIWLKFFIYLTDVKPDTGPHVFVKGSHRLMHEKARALIRRGYVRISDEEIASTFGKENLVELTGRAGTVFVADTMGFHKGKLPETGDRVIAQIEYAMPLFVPVHSNPLPLPRQLDPDLAAARAAYPWAFARYPLSA